MDKIVRFNSIFFDFNENTITITNGSIGNFNFTDICNCEILYEKAKYHGKEKPFYGTVKPTRLPLGMITEVKFYVGIKIAMKNGEELAVYISEIPTTNNSSLHIRDKKIAIEIKTILDKIISLNS